MSRRVELSATEQQPLHHSLYGAATSAAAPSNTSVARVCVSVRASDLLSPSWLSESTSLVALFAIDTDSSSNTAGSVDTNYQLLSQTELVKESNAPIFKTQFVLDRSGRARHHTYMLRVYDVSSCVIDESAYLGLAIFNLEEILQNCRQGQGGGGFVSIVLPLENPNNETENEQLKTAHATVTLSMQIPVEVGAPVPACSQAVHHYTRLINFLAPNILSTNMDLTLTSDSPRANLLSVWYRSRSTALFQMLGTVPVGSGSISHTLIISNELFLEESSAASSQDEVEAGFEVRILAHDTTALPPTALATGRAAERTLGATVNRNVSEVDDQLASPRSASLVGSCTTTFKSLLLALDSYDGLTLPIGDGARIRLNLRTRPALKEQDSLVTNSVLSPSNSPLTIPSLPSTIPPHVLAKTHDLLHTGLYFHQWTDGAQPRTIFLRLVPDVNNGASGPTRLVWQSADGASSDAADWMPLDDITHIYGGKESSPAFPQSASAVPSSDTLFTLTCASSGRSLSLEASSWQTRDAFLFGLLSYQSQSGTQVATWQPNQIEEEQKVQIVATEARKTQVQTIPATLGGSHGSLVARPAKTNTTTETSRETTTTTASANESAAATVTAAAPIVPAVAPSSPVAAAAAGPAASSDVDLNEVLSKLENLFEQGRNFIRFTSGGHKPCYISLFLRKVPASTETGGKPLFTLNWCRADQRNVSATRSIRCDEITGIALGKQTAVFRKEEAALAPASHCFSLICAKKALHLQSWNERDSDTFAFGIASLIKQYGPKPKLWQVGQYTESLLTRLEIENASELLEESDGTLQVEPQDIPTLANAQGYKCSIELAIKCKNIPAKHANTIVCVFDRDEQTEKLTYLAQTEKHTRGDPNPEFRKVFRLTYDSTVLRKLRFNVYNLSPDKKSMDDEDRIGSAMMLLKEVVDGAGIEYVYKLTHENSSKQSLLAKNGATIVISCAAKSEMALDMTTTKLAANSISETIRTYQNLLLQGNTFNFHYSSRDPAQRFLFITLPSVASDNPSIDGTLYWCDVGHRSTESSMSLPLCDIRRVLLGKKLDGSTSFDARTAASQCLTIIAADGTQLDLEATSDAQRDEWAQAITGLLRAGNVRID